MALPFDINVIKRNAHAYGLSVQEGAILSHLALDKLRSLHGRSGGPVMLEDLAAAIKKHATEEVEREKAIHPEVRQQGISIIEEMEAEIADFRGPDPGVAMEDIKHNHDSIHIKRFKFANDGLEHYFGNEPPYNLPHRDVTALSLKHYNRDIITAMCSRIELAVELGKQLRLEDLLTLYSTSKTFHDAVNAHMLSSIRMWIAHKAPEAGHVFKFKLYRRYLVPDPAGRQWQDQYEGTQTASVNPQLMREVRYVPGLRYLQLVLLRDRYCREIAAIMARHGHLLPKTMHRTLLRIWLVMDIPTSGQRQAMVRNAEFWTDVDLYNAQFFFVKLSMLFNDPIYGPSSNEMMQVVMGQKGLFPLWQVLSRNKYTTVGEVLALRVRYEFTIPEDFYTSTPVLQTVHGVPLSEVGVGHYEGWGLGDTHLLRPDEIIPIEAVARGLELDEHLWYMMLWGYVDLSTGENIVPMEEDMYISDEERVLAHADTSSHWKKKHALKKRFTELSEQQQQQIIDQDEDDTLRAMAWCGDSDEGEDTEDDDEHSLDDEINRGYILRDDLENCSIKFSEEDPEAIKDFINEVLPTLVPELEEDEESRAQAWYNYDPNDIDNDRDWGHWLDQQNGDAPLSDDESPASSSEEAMTLIVDDDEERSEGDTSVADDKLSEDEENYAPIQPSDFA